MSRLDRYRDIDELPLENIDSSRLAAMKITINIRLPVLGSVPARHIYEGALPVLSCALPDYPAPCPNYL